MTGNCGFESDSHSIWISKSLISRSLLWQSTFKTRPSWWTKCFLRDRTRRLSPTIWKTTPQRCRTHLGRLLPQCKCYWKTLLKRRAWAFVLEQFNGIISQLTFLLDSLTAFLTSRWWRAAISYRNSKIDHGAVLIFILPSSSLMLTFRQTRSNTKQ